MEITGIQVSWIKIPLTFKGIPNELRVKVKVAGKGCWSWLIRRYKTNLKMQLDRQKWCQEELSLTYCFTPPLIIWEEEDNSLKIKIRDLMTRGSYCYKLGNIGRLSERRLPNIGITVLCTENFENRFGNLEIDSTTNSESYTSAFEEPCNSFLKDCAGVPKDSVSHLDEPVIAGRVENPDFASKNPAGDVRDPSSVSEDHVSILASASSDDEHAEILKITRRRRAPVPST